MPTIDLDVRMSRLEKENHSLAARLQKLEKQRRSSIPVFLANVILLVAAGLLAGYLGCFPRGMEQLPLQARRVQAQEFVLEDRDGALRARLTVTNDGFRLVDEQGNTLHSKP